MTKVALLAPPPIKESPARKEEPDDGGEPLVREANQKLDPD